MPRTPLGASVGDEAEPGHEVAVIHARAVEAVTYRPVANVSIQLSYAGEGRPVDGQVDRQTVEVATDRRGEAEIALPFRGTAEGGVWVVRVEHEDLIPIGFPRSFGHEEIPLELVIRMAAGLLFEGTVYDPNGSPLSDARVGLAWPTRPLPPRSLSSVKLATTSKDGRFQGRHEGRLPMNSILIAYHPGYPPKQVALPWEPLLTTGRAVFSITLDEGARFVVSVIDEYGQPLAGVRLDLIGHESQVIPEWMPIAGIEPEYSGANYVEGRTDRSGVFESHGWRVGEAVRIMPVSTPEDRWRVVKVDPAGTVSREDNWAVTRAEEVQSTAVLQLSRTEPVIVRFTGVAPGLSDKEREQVRVYLRYTEEAAWLASLTWQDSETVVGEFSIASSESLRGVDYFLDIHVGTSGFETRKVRVGPYGITGSTDLGEVRFR